MNNSKLLLVLLLCYCFEVSKSQAPSCNSNIIYVHTTSAACATCANTPIKAFDPTLPFSATNPINIAVPSGGNGLAFGNNLNASTPNPTFYTIIGNFVNWWNGSSWINTGHTFPNNATNLGLAGNVLYGIGGGLGNIAVYTYSGTANSTSLIAVPNYTTSTSVGDIVGDCSGNFYLLTTNPALLSKYNSNGVLIASYPTTGLPLISGGSFAIINGNVYCTLGSTLYLGVITNTTSGSSINFSIASCFSPFGLYGDFAQCPACNLMNPVATTSINNCSIILPVELIEFNVTSEGYAVVLDWKTASEYNSKKFEVERSNDGENWKIIRTVPAAGFSEQIIDYKIIDTSPLLGLSYYRLKETDFNGQSSYSDIKWVYYNDEPSFINAWPNPSKGQLYISSSSNENISEVNIADELGRTLFHLANLEKSNVVEINTEKFNNGYYTIEIVTESHSITYKKLIIRN